MHEVKFRVSCPRNFEKECRKEMFDRNRITGE